MTVKAIHDLRLGYLKDFLLLYVPAQELRAQREAVLTVSHQSKKLVCWVREKGPFQQQPCNYGTTSLGRFAWPLTFDLWEAVEEGVFYGAHFNFFNVFYTFICAVSLLEVCKAEKWPINVLNK